MTNLKKAEFTPRVAVKVEHRDGQIIEIRYARESKSSHNTPLYGVEAKGQWYAEVYLSLRQVRVYEPLEDGGKSTHACTKYHLRENKGELTPVE